MHICEAIMNRKIVSNSLKRKGAQKLYERPAELTHRHFKENMNVNVKCTLIYTDIHCTKNNVYQARSEQLPDKNY